MFDYSNEPRGSDRWWFHKLENRGNAQLEDQSRWSTESQRLDALWRIYSYQGRSAPDNDAATQWYSRAARTAYARVIVHSHTNRIRLLGAKTDDPSVDRIIMQNMSGNGSFFREAVEFATIFGRSGVLVAPGADPNLPPVAEALDPRTFAWSLDPADPRRLRAFMKFRKDEDLGEETRHLFLPAAGEQPDRVVVFRKEERSIDWDIDPEMSRPLPDSVQGMGVPVVPMLNRNARGEFEWALDVLERIEDGIRNRLYTAKSQAFRAVVVSNLPVKDSNGSLIDYSDVFAFDPGAVTALSGGTDAKGNQLPAPEFWESAVTDIRPLLEANVADVRELAVVTSTSMAHLMPDTNQSAEGAKNSREAANSKALDSQISWNPGIGKINRLMLAYRGITLPEDVDITPLWADVVETTLSETWSAAQQARAAGFPLNTVARTVLDWNQTQIDALASDVRTQQAQERLATARQQRTATVVQQSAQGTNTNTSTTDATAPDTQAGAAVR